MRKGDGSVPNQASAWAAGIVENLQLLAQDKSSGEMSSSVEWVGGRAWSDAVAVVYRQDPSSWLAGLYVGGLASFSLLFEPVTTDPASIATLLFVNEIDDPSGVGMDDPPQFVRDGFGHIDGVIHWRIQHY